MVGIVVGRGEWNEVEVLQIKALSILGFTVGLSLPRPRGVKITYREYVKIGVPVTLAAILLSVLTLNLQTLVF